MNSHLTVWRWESGKHKSWCMPVEGFRKHVAWCCRQILELHWAHVWCLILHNLGVGVLQGLLRLTGCLHLPHSVPSVRRVHYSSLSLSSFSKCDSTSAIAVNSRSRETARTPASPPGAWARFFGQFRPKWPAVEGFRKHVASDGSLLGVSGKWGACGWSVVQLDHTEEMVPMHGMYGTLDAELEVQRAIKRAELTAFLCLFRKAIGPTMVNVDNKGIIDGLWRGETRCIGPKSEGRRTPTCGFLIWRELHRVQQEVILVEGRARQSALLQEGHWPKSKGRRRVDFDNTSKRIVPRRRNQEMSLFEK